jgi:cytoskeleton protein RodZ
MTTEPTTDVTPTEPTAGQLLRAAREKKQWSQKESANQLNLGLSLIESMESDQYDAKLLPTFIRGYLRSYSRLLKISEHEVLKAYEQLHGGNAVEPRAMYSFSNRTEKEATENRFMLLTYLVIAVFVGMLLVWWWQTHWLTDNTTEVPAEPRVLADIVTTGMEPEPPTTDVLSSETDYGLQAELVPALQAATPEWVASADDNPVTSVATAQPQQSAELASGNSSLRMRFKDDCWIDVVDAEGSRVAFGTKKAGYQLQLQGIAPFTVTLGNPTVVEIDLNDQAVDLSAFNTGRVAKFSVPLQD